MRVWDLQLVIRYRIITLRRTTNTCALSAPTIAIVSLRARSCSPNPGLRVRAYNGPEQRVAAGHSGTQRLH